MNVVIIGNGAVGLLLHKQIKQTLPTDSSLHLLPRTFHQLKHYAFESLSGEKEKVEINIAQPDKLKHADIIFICVKAFHVDEVIAQYQHLFNTNANIILSHNGMGVFDALPQQLTTTHPIYTLLTTHGSRKNEAWSVTHTGMGQYDIGLMNSSIKKAKQENVANFLSQCIEGLAFHQNITKMQWQKLAINCVINPITAIENIKNGEVLSAQYTVLRQQLIEEFIQIALLADQSFNKEEVIQTVENVAHKTSQNTSSMLSDVRASNKTEIDYINGYLVGIALRHNKEALAKTHKVIAEQVRALQKA